ASVATISPIFKGRLFEFLKNSFLEFLKRTSTASNLATPGVAILESQSKTVSLLQESVPHVPWLLQPLGADPSFVEQLVQAIFYLSLYIDFPISFRDKKFILV